MSIRVEIRENGRAYPVVTCDHCEKQIEDAAAGNALWPESQGAKPVPGERAHQVRHTHKACNLAFEQVNRPPFGCRWMANGLDHHLFMLLLNTRYDADQARHTAKLLANLP